jgi:hypothetical protein
MEIKICDEDKALYDKVIEKSKKEDDFIFRLKSLGVKYNRNINLHRQVFKDLASGSISIEEAIRIIMKKSIKTKIKNKI